MRHIVPLMDALKVHERHYTPLGDYSVTQLIDTPRRVQLLRRHGSKVKATPESQIASFVGTGVHKYWEECLRAYSLIDNKYEVERRITVSILDRIISGTFDILMGHETIYDVKTCKVWKVIFDPNHEEWTKQLNLYIHMLCMRGIKVKKAYIIAQFLDWIGANAVRDKQYPQDAAVQFEIPIWEPAKAEALLMERISLHKAAENVPDDQLMECSRKERWERFSDDVNVKYAVMKNREAKRAKRVFDALDDAVKYFWGDHKLGTDAVIEIRYAQRKRCEEWCSANQFCNSYIDYCAKLDGGTLNDYLTYDQIHQGDF